MNVPATRMNDPIVTFNAQLTKRAEQFQMVLPAHITPEKFQRTILTAVQADPSLLDADRHSLLLACMKAAQDGLLPDKREAALVVYRTSKKIDGQWHKVAEVVYLPMVYGLRKKILQSGEITDITARVVYRREAEEGYFVYEEGTEAMLRHKPMLELTEEDARDENIVAAYSMATYKDGTKSYEVMRRFEIDKVRETSQTGATRDRRGQPRTPSGPWVEWLPEQAKKTVMRRHSKTLPMSGDIVDVEGMETDVAARSTFTALASAGAEPEPDTTRLPSNDQLDASLVDQSGTEAGHTIDQDTGEITTNAAGLTEVDEETARALDAGASEEADPDDESGAEEHAEPQVATDDQPPYAGFVAEIEAGIRAAKNGRYLNGVEDKFVQQRAALPDDVAASLDALFAQRRRELRQPAEAAAEQ